MQMLRDLCENMNFNTDN